MERKVKIKFSRFRNVIREALGALRMLDILEVQLSVSGSSRDIKVEEILTDIRIIKGIATVSQDGAIDRTPTGRRVIKMVITFDSMDAERSEFIRNLGKQIKKIDGVDSVIFKSLNSKSMLSSAGKHPVY